MFTHFPKNQSDANRLLSLHLDCFSGLVQLLGPERVLLTIRWASSLCWLAEGETIATPHLTFRWCPRSPTNRRSWEVTQEEIITFIPGLKKVKKKWRKKIFKAMQQWGKILEPGTEAAFGIREPTLFGIQCQGPSEECKYKLCRTPSIFSWPFCSKRSHLHWQIVCWCPYIEKGNNTIQLSR